MENKIKVLLLTIHYPFAIASYFIKAFKHRDDIDLVTTGPFTGAWIPWLGGMTLPQKYVVSPTVPLPFQPNVGEVNYELVMSQLKGWKPDLVLTIDAGIHWKYKPADGIVAHVATDPHVLNYDHQRSVSDRFFNMQKCYSKPGDIYLPYAYSQYDHFPDDTVSKSVDAVLIGMPYENRVQWVKALRERGVSVTFENGPVFDEARALYNQGKTGLNWSSMNDLNARVFELSAMRLYSIINEVPDAHEFDFLGHCHEFKSIQEAVDGVLWAKDNPDAAGLLAEFAYDTVKPHTYDARVKQILQECGF